MPIFGSSSNTKQSSTTTTTDARQIAEGNGRTFNTGGGDLNIVADEAFDLAKFALANTAGTFRDTLAATQENSARVIASTQEAAKTETAQLGGQLVKIGVPAVALIFIVWGLSRGQ